MNGVPNKSIEEEIRIQGDLVRDLKKQKADKAKVTID